jgi:hypothetical protein
MRRDDLSMDILKGDDKFRYMMLSRLKSDCDYYLGYGNRSSNSLWAEDEKQQIETMKALHNSFNGNEKPEWLTWEQIKDYERQMVKSLTFKEWLSHNCSLTEEQLIVVSLEYGEDAEDYIQSKHHEYDVYLQNQIS